MSFDLYSAHQAAAQNQNEGVGGRQAEVQIWVYMIRGGIVSIALYLFLIVCFAVTSRIGQPSFVPVGAWFIAISAIPFSWFLKMHWSLLFFAALNWAIAGTAIGAVVGYVKCKRAQKGPNQSPEPMPLTRHGSP